jgi:hypothetical protein
LDDRLRPPVQSKGVSMIFIKSFAILPCRRGIVVIVSAYRTQDTVFESRKVIRFLGH